MYRKLHYRDGRSRFFVKKKILRLKVPRVDGRRIENRKIKSHLKKRELFSYMLFRYFSFVSNFKTSRVFVIGTVEIFWKKKVLCAFFFFFENREQTLFVLFVGFWRRLPSSVRLEVDAKNCAKKKIAFYKTLFFYDFLKKRLFQTIRVSVGAR